MQQIFCHRRAPRRKNVRNLILGKADVGKMCGVCDTTASLKKTNWEQKAAAAAGQRTLPIRKKRGLSLENI